jgi:hypothetical protein
VRPSLQPLPELTPGQAFWRGTVTALVVALPAGVMNQVLVDSGEVSAGSPVAILFWLLILLGGAAGGWTVVRLAPTATLAHASGAAALAYGIVQSLGVVRRLVTGDPISWLAFPFLALLMATCGMLGAMFARRTVRRYAPPDDAGD